jgi:UDP-N-acetylmuramoylalanine--D-glutamate ligase
MAAILACEAAGISPDKIARGLSSFKSLNHRMQLVQTINGISFYNDSKATNTDSVRYALLSFEQPIRIIMGGSDKGEDFSVLTELLLHHAKKIYITGDTSDKMREAWSGKIPTSVIDNFDDCIRVAYEESMPGDNIVLSPACASFDKFRNFEHRGDTFINIVNTIAKENEKSQ